MVIGLAANLDLPLRDRNELLIAAGFAPEYRELAYEDPALEPVRAAIDQVLAAHDPYPALVVDRHWEMITANRGLGLLTEAVAPHLLEPPANAMRIALHPEGMAPRILNWSEWRHHVLRRIDRQSRLTGEPAMVEMSEELAAFPAPTGEVDQSGDAEIDHDVFMPLLLRGPEGKVLNFFSTVATFGTAVDVTVAELSIESFFPADDVTAAACRAWAPR
jgi:MmyB-like transcription regulator ligand binding domain